MTDESRDPAVDPATDTTQLPPSSTDRTTRAYSQVPHPGDDDGFRPVGSTATFDSPSEAFGSTPPPSSQFDAAPPVVPSSPRKAGTGKIIALVSVSLVLVLVIAFASFELYTRNKIKDCIGAGVSSFTGTPVDVSLSSKPIALQWLSGDIPYVQVDTEDSTPNATKLHMRLDNLTQDGGVSKVGAINGTGFLSYDRILQMMKSSASSTSGSEITRIAGNSANGTVNVDATFTVAIFPIPVSVTMTPTVSNGKVSLKVGSATAAVFGIPADFAQGIVDQMTQSVFDTAFAGIEFSSVKVTDTGIDFGVASDNVVLKQQVSSPQGSCSSLF